jgi:hypothetical protein
VATLVAMKSKHEAVVAVDGIDFTAALLQSALTDIETQELRVPFPVLVGRTSGARGSYIVIAPAAAPGGVQATAASQDKLVLTAASAIELRCGDSLITLTKEGKITIRGVDVTNRAARACKIKGGTVSIN